MFLKFVISLFHYDQTDKNKICVFENILFALSTASSPELDTITRSLPLK